MKNYLLFKLLILLLFASTGSYAQFSLTGQVRTRTEYRDGQGTLPAMQSKPTVFTSQRTRIGLGYTTDRYKLYSAFQDVRVWGMDGSTISNMDGNKFYIHEGWGEIIFNDTIRLKKVNNLSLKLGRQEIVYDDARLLGNLDWLQQGRRHDAAIIKFNKGTFWADAGFAFNQHREKKNAGTVYVGVPYPQLGTDTLPVNAGAGSNAIGTMYKSMQYLYLAKEIGFTRIAYLFFKDDFQKRNTVGNQKFVNGVHSRMTTGLAVYASIKRKHKLEAYAYYQGNQDKTGKTLDAYSAGTSFFMMLGRKLTMGPAVDYLSGNDLTKPVTVNHQFDPLYGTPHKFWGLMDYFYVADGYGLNGNNALSPGLLNFYLRTKYKLRDNLTVTLDIHEFYAGNDVPNTTTIDPDDTMDRRLGTEFNLILQYNLTKQINIEGGYGMMLGTNTLDKLKAPAGDKRNTGHWAYLMVNIRADFLAGLYDKLKGMNTQMDEMNKKINQLNQ
jgi:hypothetical protein